MEKLYIHTEKIHNTRAAEIVVPIIMELCPATSVLDVGCGIGTWLKVFHDKFGITDLVGLDGSYVDRNQLMIDEKYFHEIDLRKPFELQRKFDIVLCLEVAEHLREASADDLVASLCRHGDLIIFSAALPGQGGQNHINEQWPDYWRRKFETHGFYFHDNIRPQIWNNEYVDWWYQQNIFLVNKVKSNSTIKSFIHPLCYMNQLDIRRKEKYEILTGTLGVRESFKIFIRSIVKKIFAKK